jgi:disulfide bond formation protein DsbB
MNNNKTNETPLPTTIADQINAFDKWFQYAENIGQQRLYNFLMAASITFVGCATLLASTNIAGHLVAVLLAVLGMFMSVMWYILGRRQAKFHTMIEVNLSRLFNSLGDCKNCEEFPIYHVMSMKDKTKPQQEDSRLSLNPLEHWLSNRRFLSAVPVLFGLAFFVTLIISTTYLVIEIIPFICRNK